MDESKPLHGGGGGGGADHLTRSGSDFVKNDTERDIVRELRRSPSLVQSIAGWSLSSSTSRPTNRRETATRLCDVSTHPEHESCGHVRSRLECACFQRPLCAVGMLNNRRAADKRRSGREVGRCRLTLG